MIPADARPVMMCLNCGYRQEASGGASYTVNDEAHAERCDFLMMIRYRTRKGIVKGIVSGSGIRNVPPTPVNTEGAASRRPSRRRRQRQIRRAR